MTLSKGLDELIFNFNKEMKYADYHYSWGVIDSLGLACRDQKFIDALTYAQAKEAASINQDNLKKYLKDRTDHRLNALEMARDEQSRNLGFFEDAFLNGNPDIHDYEQLKKKIKQWNNLLSPYNVHITTVEELTSKEMSA